MTTREPHHRELVIGDVFRSAARASPDRLAVAAGSVELTFLEIERNANRTARTLINLGVRRGDRVGVWSATRAEVVVVFAALAKLGAVYVPLNPSLTEAEAKAVVTKAEVMMLAADHVRVDNARAIADPRSSVVCIDGLDGCAANHERWAPSLSALAAAAADVDVDQMGVSETDIHAIFFTSGTTGGPKGVELSHRTNFLRSHPGALLEPRGAIVCPYPLFHMGAWTIALQQWQARGAAILLGSANAQEICDAVERFRAQRINCIPAVWRRVLDHLEQLGTSRPDLSSIQFADSGTSATPPELLATIQRALPQAAIRIFYGSTEAGCVASLGPEDIDRKPGSCGVPAPLTEISVDDSGELLARGQLLFNGYYADPHATASAFRDGWYHTGDLVDVDDEGYLTIVGRVNDVIRTGGETVVPSEVEVVISRHPNVADVTVVGIPDRRWGEVVCAVIVTKGDDAPGVAELREHCAGQLATYKHPRRVAVVDEIPRTAVTRQVQRRLVIEQLALAD